MRMWALAVAAALALGAGAPAGASDPRVQYVPYDPGRVVTLMVDGGYAAVVELERGEAIENVVVGNSAVWQVTVNSGGNRVVVKPLAGAAPTDMILITADRRYVFLLQPADGSGQGHFLLAFTYPDARPGTGARSGPAMTYKFAGEKRLFPKGMRDDGKRTTITWDEKTALPAVFSLEAGGGEAIVNGRMIGRDYVIEGTARRYVFRLGEHRAVATRSRKGGSQ